MKIFWYGHSRYRIETGSSAIHIDPFSERRSHVHLPGLDPNADKFVAEMKGGDVAVPRVGQAITD
jgi:L-ascorbate metabolism protein UlaG (beta-lactamase superfamily)